MASGIVDELLRSEEPSVQWRVRTEVLGEPADSAELRRLRDRIRSSDRVLALLGRRGPDGRSLVNKGIYAKWQGAHWVLAALADLGYPPGDEDLRPLAEQVRDGWLGDEFSTEFEATAKAAAYSRRGVPVMAGRHRRCASQQGNALRSLCRLGLADDRTGGLVERLLHWQWPDGGWNCDKNPAADTSSVAETLLPLRGLTAYAESRDDHEARRAARRAAEVLLQRRLLFRRSDETLINTEFTRLHYPLYWHYDVARRPARAGRARVAGGSAVRRRPRSAAPQAMAGRRLAGRAPLLPDVARDRARPRLRRLGRHQHAPEQSLGHRRRRAFLFCFRASSVRVRTSEIDFERSQRHTR